MAKEATRNAYGKALAELVVERDDVLVLDADLTKSTKTIEAKKARPEHHFNMGIAEGNMMAVAAGMAASNKVFYPQLGVKTLLDGGRRRTKNLYGVVKRTVPAGQVRQ